MATIFELRDSSGRGILAIPFSNGRRRRAVRLVDGAIVEGPTASQTNQIPKLLEAVLPLAAGDDPATIHHLQLGLVVGYLNFSGVFVLPTGEVAAVYGAEAEPLGVERRVAP